MARGAFEPDELIAADLHVALCEWTSLGRGAVGRTRGTRRGGGETETGGGGTEAAAESEETAKEKERNGAAGAGKTVPGIATATATATATAIEAVAVTGAEEREAVVETAGEMTIDAVTGVDEKG